jgi:hypothetical protein
MKTNYLPVTATLSLPSGKTKRWLFQPKTLLIDDQTEYVVAMHLKYDDGSSCNLLLHPQNASQTEFLRFAGNILASVGADLIAGQIKTGYTVIDNVCSHIISKQITSEFENLLEIAIQSQCCYYAIDNGEMVVIEPISVFDLTDA